MGRREMTTPYTNQGHYTVRDILHSYTANLAQLVHETDSAGEEDDSTDNEVGFAIIKGRQLAHLGPMMFLSAQLKKTNGVPWQLINGQYTSVWLTAGTSLMRPLPLDVGLRVLKASNLCAADEDPFRPSAWEIMMAQSQRGPVRRLIGNAEDSPDTDEDEEVEVMLLFA